MTHLYIVSTPIGNMEDITLRAVRVLCDVQLIAAEDTRHTRTLLAHHAITTPCISYHEHNKLVRQDTILAALATGDVALVSDAGTPTISDPGYELVRAAIAAGYTVVPIPGAAAPLAALVASGLPTNAYHFVGFLPRRKNERQRALTLLAPIQATLICFEAPHRLVAMLTDTMQVLGNRQVVLAREITKRFEQFQRGQCSDMLAYYQDAAHSPRGEYTVVIAGNEGDGHHKTTTVDDTTLLAQFRVLVEEHGYRASDAARVLARTTGIPRATLYALWLHDNKT